ncbi:MAG: peptidoglycan bridge formation glycyltransferase FemA/FemB family protein [Bacillota bacterium]|nr:peptidoglycan bridge formation glycyltransferase FemA/FemB family protein [Bacillota bacterium]
MYTTRIIDVNEKDRYNRFVKKHWKGHFLQTFEWGEVKRFMGWESLPLVLEKDGEIQGALLILKRKLPLPGVNKSIFYAPRGPVVNIDNEELCQVLFEGARKAARDQGAIFLKIDPDVEVTNQGFQEVLRNCGFQKNENGLDFEGVQPAFVFRLDIEPSEIKLMENMHSKTRYNIRLAKKKGVTIREVYGKEDLKVFYEILEETAKRDHFLIRGYEYFETIWDQMVETGMAKIFIAEYEGQPVSGTLAFILGDKAWYLYGASSNEHRKVMPNYLIQWEMICWAKENGCTLYDFRGVSGDLDESNPLYGLYRFKKGFNGDFTEFVGDWDVVYSRFYYFLWNRALPVYQKITRTVLRRKQQEAE